MIEQNTNMIYLLCDRISQPIGSLYTSSLDWKTLRRISFSDPRVLEGYDDDGNEVYRGIQRALDPERVKQIQKYVNEYDYSTFPTSIILNIPHEKIDIYDVKLNLDIEEKEEVNNVHIKSDQLILTDENKVLLVIPNEKSIAQIIDGQHRMSGFDDNSNLTFDLPITIFIDQTVEQQAEIFSTINGKQTRVTPSLVYELFGISERESPYKTAHNITKLLNETQSSPLKGWIKRLGKSNDFYEGYITQSTVNKNLFKLICGNAKQVDEDMRTLARGEKLILETPFSRNKAVLRSFYISNDEAAIIKILFNYFNAIKEVLKEEWDKEDSVFKKTIGFEALIKIFIDLAEMGLIEKKLSLDFFKNKLKGVTINPKVTLSSKGVRELYSQFKVHYSN